MEFLTEHWLSVGTAVFLLGMVLYGHYRGFLRLAVSMTALLLTLVVVRAASPYMSDFLRSYTPVQEFVEQGLLNITGANDIFAEQELPPADQRSLIEELRLPEQMREALIEHNNNEVYRMLGVDAFMDYIGVYLSNMVLNLVGSIVLFILVYVAIRLIIRWLDVLAKLPILYGMNQIAGAVLGGVQGLLVIWILCLIVTACSHTEWAAAVISQISESPWLMFLYKNNIFNWLVAGILNSIS